MNLPSRIGKYELQKFLGGGMSHVFRAQDTVLKRTVAVKILTEQGVADPETRTRFLDEAEVSASITHDNIIRTYDYGEEQGKPYMVMEFLVGMDLRTAIKEAKTGDLSSRLKIALQIARALEHVHTHRIVHRDIKPENIHLDESGRVKLMDFGIAKREGINRTQAGFALGTPYYMAPEQVLGEAITGQADVYSFGVLFYELLTGTKPILGDTVERLFYAILNEPLDLTSLQQGGVPEDIQQFIARCTAKKPEFRPHGFGAVCEELERFIRRTESGGTPTRAVPIPPPPDPTPVWKRPAVVGLSLAAVLLTAAAGVVISRRGEVSAGAGSGSGGSAQTLAATLPMPSGDMVLVPAGQFLFGQEKRPELLPAFYVDRTEVTNGAYAAFCRETSRPLPSGFRADRPQEPVTRVSHDDAAAFAAWAGKRLPSLKEWERAARGTDGRSYPWGDAPQPASANVRNNPSRPTPGLVNVDAFPEGASPVGALQMAGNVAEITDTLQTPSTQAVSVFANLMTPSPTITDAWYVVKGGSFNEPVHYGLAYEQIMVPGAYGAPNIGFRCVKAP